MMDQEIYLILLAFFDKVISSSSAPADLTIKIAIPNSYPPHPCNIKLVRCVKDLNIAIKKILEEKFNITIKEDHSQCTAWILVKADQILAYKSNLK
nr:unnamed protein product [Callosobruchus chinensis]